MNVMGGHDEREQTLNQLLVEMDGFETNKGVIIMAATNRPEILDPALLRPGRLDRQVLVDRPDINGREAILKIHSKNVVLGPEVDLRMIAGRTPGFVGADLANIINEAALLAARNDKEMVELTDFDEAIDRVVAGLQKKNRVMNARRKKLSPSMSPDMPLWPSLSSMPTRCIKSPLFPGELRRSDIPSSSPRRTVIYDALGAARPPGRSFRRPGSGGTGFR
jgi:hypothetical protein